MMDQLSFQILLDFTNGTYEIKQRVSALQIMTTR